MVDSMSAILIQVRVFLNPFSLLITNFLPHSSLKKTSSIIINCPLYLLLFSFHSIRRPAHRHRNLARDSLHDSDFSMTVHMKLQLVDDVSQARHLCEEFFVWGKEQIWWRAQRGVYQHFQHLPFRRTAATPSKSPYTNFSRTGSGSSVARTS